MSFGIRRESTRDDHVTALEHDDAKHDITMVENADGQEKSALPQLDASDQSLADMKGQTLTGYEDLSLWQTVVTFKKTSLMCLAVTFSAACEGYEVSSVVSRSSASSALTGD
jgi:hypothetical protein